MILVSVLLAEDAISELESRGRDGPLFFPKARMFARIWQQLLLLLMCMTLAGCGQSTQTAEAPWAMAGIDPQLVEQQGQLSFVRDVQSGTQLAAQLQKPCLLFFTAQWCTYCHQMAETAFQDPQVGQLGQRFVCVLVDADRDAALCRQLGISGFPTVQFLSPQGKTLHRLVGRQSGPALAQGMQSALDRFAWVQPGGWNLR